MALLVVHFIGAGNLQGWATTACGLEGTASKVKGEYNTAFGNRIAVRYREWHGVTCKRCLRREAARLKRINR